MSQTCPATNVELFHFWQNTVFALKWEVRTLPSAWGEGWAVDVHKAGKKNVTKSTVRVERRRQHGQQKTPGVNGARQVQVSAVTGYFGGLTCPETTNTEFFKSVEITSQAALRESLSRFLQWTFPYNNGDIHVTEWTHPCLVKKATFCYSLSLILLFIGWGRKAPSYFKIQGSLTVQPEIMPFSCTESLKKVCPDFLEVCNSLLQKAIFFSKDSRHQQENRSLGGIFNEKEGGVRVTALLPAHSLPVHGQERWTWALAEELAVRGIRVPQSYFTRTKTVWLTQLKWDTWSLPVTMQEKRLKMILTTWYKENIATWIKTYKCSWTYSE